MITKRINRYDIRTPIWNGSAKKRMIGLAPSRMKGYDELHVQILQTNKHNERIYPDTYVFTQKFFNEYEGEVVSRYGIALKYFFVDDLLSKSQNNWETFVTEARKYGDIIILEENINPKNKGEVSGKPNTGYTKYKPTRTKI